MEQFRNLIEHEAHTSLKIRRLFLQHCTLLYLEESWADYGTEPIFTNSVSFIQELLKSLKIKLDFSLLQNLSLFAL